MVSAFARPSATRCYRAHRGTTPAHECWFPLAPATMMSRRAHASKMKADRKRVADDRPRLCPPDMSRETAMKLPRREFLRLAAAAAVLPAAAVPASAQSYPTRPVRLILGFPAGGSTDLVARIMGAWLTERLGQSVVVENKPGGGTNVAAQTAINSPPDGYTLLFVTTTNAINATFYPTLPFNVLRDVAPVAPRRFAVRHRGESVRAGRDRRRIHRARESQPRQDQHGLVRHRHHQPSGVGAVQAHDRRRHGARAVSRRGADGDRSHRWARGGGHRRLAELAAAHPLGRTARARRHRSGAIGRGARRADRGRDRAGL